MKDNSRCYQVQYPNKEAGNINNQISQDGAVLSECQIKCLTNDACKSLSHYTGSFGPVCLLYGSVIPENELKDLSGGLTGAHYDKNCPPGKPVYCNFVTTCDTFLIIRETPGKER